MKDGLDSLCGVLELELDLEREKGVEIIKYIKYIVYKIDFFRFFDNLI